jgi:D-serine deaminase-like pyridoxal phosphate-dependent protein
VRAGEAVELSLAVPRLQLLLDHPATFEALEQAARSRGLEVRAFLKVDCGYHRAGVDPVASDSLALARAMASSPHVRLAGILTHAGHSYGCRNRDEIARVARQERDVAVSFARRLRDSGIEVPEVSIGSTPTMSVIDELEGVTEVRPGNYVFFDAFQAAIGSCELDAVAFSVLASVIGSYPANGRLLLDAGALALSKDEGPRELDAAAGYGIVAGPLGELQHPSLRLVSLSQEHGVVRGPSDAIARLAVGDRLRIIANHSCLAAALHPTLFVVRGSEVVERWEPVRGW